MNQNILLKYLKTLLACLVLLPIASTTHAQNRKARVLFIGNSYTEMNYLPQIVADMAASTGDTLVYDKHVPGGATFYHHYMTFTPTREKIRAGGWDYVVLQEQSLDPARADWYFNDWVYPYAKHLVDDVRLYNPCAEVIFYMTWGRKNGFPPLCPDPYNFPNFCTYHTMDSVLRVRYMQMTDGNRATVSPVGAVWRYIRNNHASIELYDADESHPSPAGSYAGACSFYTAIFKKPADNIRYNFSLPATEAATIRKVATKVVYDSLHFWRIGQYETFAGFDHRSNLMQPAIFTNMSVNATQYAWNFGDGQTSTAADPTHTYKTPGIYRVRLISTGASCSDTAYTSIRVKHEPLDIILTVAPNPATDKLYITCDLFEQGNCRVQLINSTGQPVLEQRLSAALTQSIHVAGIASGVYTLRILHANGNVLSKKVMIQ